MICSADASRVASHTTRDELATDKGHAAREPWGSRTVGSRPEDRREQIPHPLRLTQGSPAEFGMARREASNIYHNPATIKLWKTL